MTERNPQPIVVEVSDTAGRALRRFEVSIVEDSPADAAQAVGDVLEDYATTFKRTKVKKPAFSEDDLTNAAMCLWEAMLEEKQKQLKTGGDFYSTWVGHGTVHMRSQAAALAEPALAVYAALPEETRDAVAFDWDFIPAFLEQVEWVAGNADLPLEPAFIAVRVRDALRGLAA